MGLVKTRIGRGILLVVLSAFPWLPACLHAQMGMLSPYSTYGAGALQPYLNIRNMSMGNLAVGLSGVGDMNPFNPATYRTGVDTLSVRFDIGFNIGMNKLKQQLPNGRVSNQSTAGGLGNLEFYFPLCKWYKMAVYLLPYTDMNYRSSYFSDSIPHIGVTQLIHGGTGGLAKAGWGHSIGWGPVSVGANFSYVFGKLEQYATLTYLDDTLASYAGQSDYRTTTRLNGLSVDVGITYAARLFRDNYLTIGAAYSLTSDLYGKRTTLAQGVFSSGSDTAFLPANAQKGKVSFPAVLRVGLSYEQRGQFVVGADVSYAWWKDFEDYGRKYDYFDNTLAVNVGAELKNDPQAASKARHVAYRIGGFYQQQCLTFNNHRMNAYGVSLGLGIPVRKSRSIINIGLQYGRTGSLKFGQVREDYLRVGVSFSSLETWFVKPKYD